MATGTYGTVRPSDIDPKDLEVLYTYSEERSTLNTELRRLNSVDVLTPFKNNIDGSKSDEILGGLYNLRLDSEKFSKVGFYTVYIRPKPVRTTIMDCGVLSSLNNVRGIVIDINNVPSEDREKFVPQGMVGYRVEYINPVDGKKIRNFYRIVTASFYCSPVLSNVTNSNQKSVKYQFSNTPTNYIFLTLTPSMASSAAPNNIPFIGQPGQTVILCNTSANPKVIEINVVEHDSSTLAHALYGNQSKAMDTGIYTIYDNDNKIYKQYNLFEIKDEYNETLYEIREQRDDIDETLNFDDINN